MNILVGLKTNRPGAPPLLPTGGRSSAVDRLRLFLGLSVPLFLKTFPLRINVLDHRGAVLRRELRGSIFVLGREAWRTLGLPRRGWFAVEETEGAKWVLLPHPSGRSLVYNSRAARGMAKRIVYRHLEQPEEDHDRRSHRRPPSGRRGGGPHQETAHDITEPMVQVLGEAK